MKSYQEIIRRIQKEAALEKWEQVRQLIFENHLLESNHVDIIGALINIYILEGNIQQAEAMVRKGLLKHEFNADMNFNAGIVYNMLEDYEKSLYHFFGYKS